MNIPKKDLDIIEDVASYIAFNHRILGYPVEDLKQDMVFHGLKSYQKWDDKKHQDKVKVRRDKNLRMFLRTYMMNRRRNLYKNLNTQKRKANLIVTSLNPGDTIYGILANTKEKVDLTEADFSGLDLSKDEIRVLLYISGNGLEYIQDDLEYGKNRVESIINSLSQNDGLRSLLYERLQTQ